MIHADRPCAAEYHARGLVRCALQRLLRFPAGFQLLDRCDNVFAGSVFHAIAALEVRYEALSLFSLVELNLARAVSSLRTALDIFLVISNVLENAIDIALRLIIEMRRIGIAALTTGQ